MKSGTCSRGGACDECGVAARTDEVEEIEVEVLPSWPDLAGTDFSRTGLLALILAVAVGGTLLAGYLAWGTLGLLFG
jgi:hypothetical protein